jgi:hypothetical protein
VKKFGILSMMALVAGLSAAGASVAQAAQAPGVGVRTAAPGPAVAADYIWNGRHYVYVWHGRYFNHRRWHNNGWVYF